MSSALGFACKAVGSLWGTAMLYRGCPFLLGVLWNRAFSSMGFSQALHGRDMSPGLLVCAQRKGRGHKRNVQHALLAVFIL